MSRIIGVDPGTTNLGYCIIDACKGNIIRSANINIGHNSGTVGAFGKIATGVANSLREPLSQSQFSAVEQQMRARMHVVAGAAMGASVALGVPTAGVGALAVKRHFGIPPTGNHARNKQLALEFVHKQGITDITSHEADAYLLARYAAEVILKTMPYNQHERQSPVSGCRRRVCRTGVLPVPTSDVRVPREETIR